jgi:DNA-binding NarL/FixJ family response regulator
MAAMRTFDEDARARWFRGPIGGALSGIVGPIERLSGAGGNGPAAVALEEGDTAVLRLLTQGRTNGEIAAELGIAEADVRRELARMFAKIGASSRAEATAFAFREQVV